VNVSFPVTAPDVVGMHSTPTLHVPLGAKEPSQVSLDFRNGGAVRMLAKLIVTFLEPLVARTVFSGLVLPTGTLPKLRLPGLTLRFAFAVAAFAVADAARPIVRSKVKNPSAKTDDFVRDMTFLPRNTHQRVSSERPLTSRPTGIFTNANGSVADTRREL
jgi:hypothetical protein